MNSFLMPIVLVFILILSACSLKKKEAPLVTPPNVLFIMADDLNDKLGCYGDSIVITSNIDKLASKGTVFLHAYCQQALCNPSRSSMLTGMRPSSLGVQSLKPHFRDKFPNAVTLPQLFKKNGYFTARAGKIYHMGVPDAIAVRGDGKDDSLSWNETFNAPGFELNANGAFYNATPWESHQVGTGGAISWLRAEKGDAIHHDYNVATKIIEWMETHQAEPFFLAAGFIRPHVPWVAPKRFFEWYDTIDIPLPESQVKDRKDMPEEAWKSWASNFNVPKNDRKNAIKAYYATISFVDQQVGRLMEALEQLNLTNNTIIVFVSDHGFQLGEHGLWFKNFLFRESAISPLIIHDPRIKSTASEYNGAVELLDIYPTLADIALDQNIPEFCEGKSLKHEITSTGTNYKNFAVVESHRGKIHGTGLYTNKWAYMNWGNGKELYDLSTDKYQLNNLAGKPVYKKIEQMLHHSLDSIVNL